MPSDMLGAYLDKWDTQQEDDFLWACELLGRFTYKPSWRFEASRAPQHGGVKITIEFMAEDSRRGPNQMPSYREMTYVQGDPFRIERDDLIPVSGQFILDRYVTQNRDEKRFWEWLRSTLNYMERHETDEWFRIDGNLPYDPHRV